MSRMFRSLDLLVLSCLFLPVISETGEIPPPQNLTLRWINDFKPELSWTPQDSERNCKYIVTTTPQTGQGFTIKSGTPKWSEFITMGGRSLSFSVTTNCNGGSSKPAFCNITYPELVKNLSCRFYAPEKSRCQWIPASDAPDLRFFYQLTDMLSDTNKAPSELQECSSYNNSTKGVGTVCELKASNRHLISIFFNGTVNNKPARNTFPILLKNHVDPPALNWTVVESKDAFNISWNAPDIMYPSFWKYSIRYTECDKLETVQLGAKERSCSLVRKSHCQYRIAIQAKLQIGGQGETPWTVDKSFEKDNDLDALVFGAFIIPCVVAFLAALMFVCCWRNKDKFFPKIIKPMDLITDTDNNNKSNLYNLQAPGEEEQTCEITVLDPEVVRLDC